jgi:signal transduction histidine kinase
MNRDERRLIIYSSLLMLALLALAGVLLRNYVARTLVADANVQTAFLDLALRDRSRYLAETLQSDRQQGRWPENLADILTRNHADYNRDIFIQVFEADGRLAAASVNTPSGTTLSPKAQRVGREELHWLSDETKGADGRTLRLVTYPIYIGAPDDPKAQALGFAQAGLTLPDAARAVSVFTWTMIPALAGFGILFVIALRAAAGAASHRLRREAASLNASQQRFIGDAAHELGTPLAILRGEMDIALRRERSAEDYRAALVSCREEIERLSGLSENLLTLATADAGQQLVQPAPCDAVEIARAVHQRFARFAAGKDIAFTLAAPESLPWSADAVAVGQILGNLVSNALRHTPPGESVALTVARESHAIVFQVTDTGEGIPPAHLPRIFERFHRVDKARSRAGAGAGLGLAIVKSFVEAHGGTVAVTSEVGKGSTFTCRFPVTVSGATAFVPSHAKL